MSITEFEKTDLTFIVYKFSMCLIYMHYTVKNVLKK